MDSLFIDERQLSESTIDYNAKIVQFIATYIKTDLDKLTVRDINTFKRAILEWKRADGKEIAQKTKNQYFIGLKRFLTWYEESVDENCGYNKLCKQIKQQRVDLGKVPSDLLTTEEIEKMIAAADSPRNKAIIATLAEAGCRMGEIQSCRVKDIEHLTDGCRITFPKGKTGSRTVLLQYAACYINDWLLLHPDRNNPDAPLWVTKRRKRVVSKTVKKFEHTAMAHETIYGVVMKAAEDANIKKRVHPHLFRHTTATYISSKMSEFEMKEFLGWARTSSMPAHYIHLSNDDLDNKVRAMNGMLISDAIDDKGLKVIKCIRCKNVVPANTSVCQICHLPLSEDTIKEVEANEKARLEHIVMDVFAKINLNKMVLAKIGLIKNNDES